MNNTLRPYITNDLSSLTFDYLSIKELCEQGVDFTGTRRVEKIKNNIRKIMYTDDSMMGSSLLAMKQDIRYFLFIFYTDLFLQLAYTDTKQMGNILDYIDEMNILDMDDEYKDPLDVIKEAFDILHYSMDDSYDMIEILYDMDMIRLQNIIELILSDPALICLMVDDLDIDFLESNNI